jgi:hypothetical protein
MASSTASAILVEQPASSSAPCGRTTSSTSTTTDHVSRNLSSIPISSLRAKAKFVKPRRPRKRWPRIVILLLLILLAATWVDICYGTTSIKRRICIGENARRSCGSCAHGYTCAHRYTYSDADSFDYTDSVSADMDTDAFTNGPAYAHAYTAADIQPGRSDWIAAPARSVVRRAVQVATDIPIALLPPEIVETTLKSILDIQRRQPELVNQARDRRRSDWSARDSICRATRESLCR